MGEVGNWLAKTGLAVALQDTPWAIPAIQCVHIAAIALLLMSSVVGQMRFAGLLATDESAACVAAWLRPRLRGFVAALLATGLLMIVSEPNRTLGNAVFWAKMGVVAFAFGLSELQVGAALSQRPAAAWVRPAAFGILLLWIVAIACGRWIAYLY